MYESYWNLNSRPFCGGSDSDFFFAGSSAESTLQRLTYALENLSGPVLIPGETGTGKTTLVRRFAQEFGEFQPFVQLIFPMLSADESLRMLLRELTGAELNGIPARDTVLSGIWSALTNIAASGSKALLFFDDAHLYSEDTLLQILHPLLCMEEADRSNSLRIILAGQPALVERISRVTPVSERIAVCCPLSPLSRNETAEFITASLAASGQTAPIFTEPSIDRLFRATQGNMRKIARLSEMALLVGFAEQQEEIDADVIDSVAAEILPAAA